MIRFVESENFRCWLKADIQSPETDFRFTPNNGHSSTNVRFLPDYTNGENF